MRNQAFPEILSNLNVVTITPRAPANGDAFSSAYATWKLVWSETFLELDGLKRLHADDFTRQDEVICIFNGNQCLASGSMRWVDLSLTAVREDSYFKMWPAPALEQLGQNGSDIIICSNLTVHPEARSGRLGFSMKDVMVGLLVKRLLNSGAKAMTGTMRADRGMHKTTYRFGATVLVPNLSHHNAPVDLVAFFPNQMKFDEDTLTYTALEYLWTFKRSNPIYERKAA